MTPYPATWCRHLLLVELVPVLVLLGLGPAVAARAGPLFSGIAASLILVVWHLPAFFDVALRHAAIHVGEHISFLVAGVLL